MSNNLLKNALAYARRGWPIIPMNFEKEPMIKKWPTQAFTTPKQIKDWWAEFPDANIGVLTGKKSKICVLDIDMPDGTTTLKKLEEIHGTLPQTLTSKTGSGGKHYFFKIPDGTNIGRNIRFDTDIDLLGNKSIAILPPSRTKKGEYKWTNKEAIADMPSWLHKANHKEKEHPLEGANGTTTQYGATALTNGIEQLRAANLGERNNTLYYVSLALGHLISGKEICESLVVSSLFTEATQLGLEANEIPSTIRSGIDKSKKRPRTSPYRVLSHFPATSANIENIHPIPFETPDLSQFPLAGMPDAIQKLTFAMAEEMQVQPETVFINLLGAFAIATQKKFQVEVKQGYREQINLYAICALRPAERKSAVVKRCKQPLIEWEMAEQKKYAKLIEEATTSRETIQIAIKAKQKEAAKAANKEERESINQQIMDLKAEQPDIPSLPRLLIDDITPESLAERLARHGERLGILEAEGGVLGTLAGRYSNGVPNLDAVLKSWNGEGGTIDRKGKDSIMLINPVLTMVLTPQPTIVKRLTGMKDFKERGLSGRFLYMLPKSLLGSRSFVHKACAGAA